MDYPPLPRHLPMISKHNLTLTNPGDNMSLLNTAWKVTGRNNQKIKPYQ